MGYSQTKSEAEIKLEITSLHIEFVESMYTEFGLAKPYYANDIVFDAVVVHGGLSYDGIIHLNKFYHGNKIQSEITLFHESGHVLLNKNRELKRFKKDESLEEFLTECSVAIFLRKSNRHVHYSDLIESERESEGLFKTNPDFLKTITELDTPIARSLILQYLGRDYFFSKEELRK